MKRHPSLAALSRDHHHALVLAQALKPGAPERLTKSLPAAPSARLEHVRNRFTRELEPHFLAEENVLLPPCRAHGGVLAEQAARIAHDHQTLRALLGLGAGDATAPEDALAKAASAMGPGDATGAADAAILDRLERFASLLDDHVRFEDRVWFPTLERDLDELEALGSALGVHAPEP